MRELTKPTYEDVLAELRRLLVAHMQVGANVLRSIPSDILAHQPEEFERRLNCLREAITLVEDHSHVAEYALGLRGMGITDAGRALLARETTDEANRLPATGSD